ncbi:putative fatty-acid--CoA ligase FadD10 [Borealophlyctis nickersoniae]|nr:putative fatty-acid--CoA ligase FadD10 [Borealophlyctis nickersoniae]
MTVHVFSSTLPSVDVPVVDPYSFVFEHRPAPEEKTAMIDAVTGEKWTYGELKNKIGRFASGITDASAGLGVTKGSVVGVFAGNSMEYPIVVHGVLRADQLKDAGATSLVTVAPLLPVATEAAKKAGIDASRIILFGAKTDGMKTVREIMESAKDVLPPIKRTEEELKNEPAYLCYSSGTTGKAKGVQTTHYNMVANAAQIYAALYREENEVWTGVLPMFHIYGLNLALHTCFYSHGTLVCFEKFSLPVFLNAVQTYRISNAWIVPPIVLALAKHPMVSEYDLSSLRVCISGAAPLGGDLAEACTKRIGCVVSQGYGMTECTPVTHIMPELDVVPGSIGKLVPNCEARLVDPDTGKDCPVNESGEMWIRGPNVMKGYHNNPEATAATIDTEGWLHTGDIAVVDDRGYFFIVDRLKELIKYNGFQVPPAELESHLLAHPLIADAAVIPRPDVEGAAGEVPRAFVVLKPDANLTEKEVQDFVAERVAYHKKLRGGVKFVDAIPKAASGKILRRVLRELDHAEMQEEHAKKAASA